MENAMLEILDGFSQEWVLMEQHSKSPFLRVILNWSKWILVVVIPTEILLTKLLSIDHSWRCELNIYIHTEGNESQKSEQNLS